MSQLQPSILVNPAYTTNNIDTHKAGWYQIQPSSSNIALRVGYSNLDLDGEIRLNTSVIPPVFQGNNGSGWVDFNSLTGPIGPNGKDFTNAVNFNNLGSNTSPGTSVSLGNIFATTYVNIAENISNVNIRSLQGGNYTINSNLSVNSISLTQNSNVITISTTPLPYTWDFTGNHNTVKYLKDSSNTGTPSNSWGETSKWIVKTGTTVYKGQAVKLAQDTTNINNSNITNIVIVPITYTTLQTISPISSFNMLGIATNTASGGSICTVCTKGITTVQCTGNTTTDFIKSNSVSSIGIPGVVGTDGFIFNNQNSYLQVIYIQAGYFLESGNNIANYGNYVLFYVDPIVQNYTYHQTPSDKRLKENIDNISSNDKDKLLQLVPKTYNFINDEKKLKRYGLIAQEVEELFPEIVATNNDDGIKALNYVELIPLLLEKVKDLNTIISSLIPELSKTN